MSRITQGINSGFSNAVETLREVVDNTKLNVGRVACGAIMTFSVAGGTASVILAPTPVAAAPATANSFEPETSLEDEVAAPASEVSTTSTDNDEKAQAIVESVVNKYAIEAVKKDPTNLTLKDAKAYYKGLSEKYLTDISKEQALRDSIEKVVAQEVTPEVEAKLTEKGLNPGDYTLLTDVDAELTGEREAGEKSLNHGKVAKTLREYLERSGEFSEEDIAVSVESIARFAPQEVAEAIMAGDFESYNVKIYFLQLNSPWVKYTGMSYNSNGKLAIDDMVTRGANDVIGLVTFTKDGEEGDLYIREDCSIKADQSFETIEIENPETPATPTPEEPTPEENPRPTLTTAVAEVCVGLNSDGSKDIREFQGIGATTEEALENAKDIAEQNAGNCEVISTTTTTTNPDSSTTTTTEATTTTTEATTTTTSTSTTIPGTTTTVVITTTTTTPSTTTTAPTTTTIVRREERVCIRYNEVTGEKDYGDVDVTGLTQDQIEKLVRDAEEACQIAKDAADAENEPSTTIESTTSEDTVPPSSRPTTVETEDNPTSPAVITEENISQTSLAVIAKEMGIDDLAERINFSAESKTIGKHFKNETSGTKSSSLGNIAAIGAVSLAGVVAILRRRKAAALKV